MVSSEQQLSAAAPVDLARADVLADLMATRTANPSRVAFTGGAEPFWSPSRATFG